MLLMYSPDNTVLTCMLLVEFLKLMHVYCLNACFICSVIAAAATPTTNTTTEQHLILNIFLLSSLKSLLQKLLKMRLKLCAYI